MRRMFIALLFCCLTTDAVAQTESLAIQPEWRLNPAFDLSEPPQKNGFAPTFAYQDSVYDGMRETTVVTGGEYRRGNFAIGAFAATATFSNLNSNRLSRGPANNAGDGLGYYFPSTVFPEGAGIQVLREEKEHSAYVVRMVFNF